jgi:hypothetical protein
MTELIAILALAALFVAFGVVRRPAADSCSHDCGSCSQTCDSAESKNELA